MVSPPSSHLPPIESSLTWNGIGRKSFVWPLSESSNEEDSEWGGKGVPAKPYSFTECRYRSHRHWIVHKLKVKVAYMMQEPRARLIRLVRDLTVICAKPPKILLGPEIRYERKRQG